MIDVAGINARVKAFHLKHSKAGPPVFHNDQWHYPDSARRDSVPEGLLFDGETEPFERCSAIVLYHKAKLAQAQTALADLKDTLLHQVSGSDADLVRLKALKADVEFAEAGLRQAQQALEATEVYQARKGHQESIREAQQRQSAWKQRVRQAVGAATADES